MGKKRRFISRGERWSNGIITIDRQGREFDVELEAPLIDMILKGGVYGGGHVIEVPTAEDIRKGALEMLAEAAGLKQAVKNAEVEAVEVEPLDGNIDEEKELQAIAEEARKRKEDAEDEQRRIAERRAQQQAAWEKYHKPSASGKKRGRPPKNKAKAEG